MRNFRTGQMVCAMEQDYWYHKVYNSVIRATVILCKLGTKYLFQRYFDFY